jgi:NADH dehydrogenase [ubiquinone] 1 alpha subcomplex assembly factor 7
MIGLDGERFAFVAGAQPMDAAVPPAWRHAEEGAIVETSPAAAAIVGEIATRLARQGGAALLIDYGRTEPRLGSTLQAVRAHRKVDPLALPGEADLTAWVDFAVLAEVARARGARWLGTVSQGAFLRAIGIETRARQLAAASPGRAAEIAAACDRLVADEAMGALFKVMALAAPGWPEAAPFASR